MYIGNISFAKQNVTETVSCFHFLLFLSYLLVLWNASEIVDWLPDAKPELLGPSALDFSFCSFVAQHTSAYGGLRWDWRLLVLPPFASMRFLHKRQTTVRWLLGFPSSVAKRLKCVHTGEVTFALSTSTGPVVAGSDTILITSRIDASAKWIVVKTARVSIFNCRSKMCP